MSETLAVLQFWGKILLHNQLITELQWHECQAEHAEQQGRKTIEDILLGGHYIQPVHAKMIRQRMAAILAKQKAGTLPSEVSGANTHTSHAEHAPPARVAAAANAPAAPVSTTTTNAAAAHVPAQVATNATPTAAASAPEGEVLLAADTETAVSDGTEPHWRPSDAEWVDDTATSPDLFKQKKSEDIAQIDVTTDADGQPRHIAKQGDADWAKPVGLDPSLAKRSEDIAQIDLAADEEQVASVAKRKIVHPGSVDWHDPTLAGAAPAHNPEIEQIDFADDAPVEGKGSPGVATNSAAPRSKIRFAGDAEAPLPRTTQRSSDIESIPIEGEGSA